MKMRLSVLSFALSIALTLAAPVAVTVPLTVWSVPASAQQLQPKEGWFKELADFDFVRANVDIPPKKGVAIIDARPAARLYDVAHIPGAISIPDSQFDKFSDRLPADKSTLLIFYCGGLECMLSHNSAHKAQKLGYTNIRVYAAGMPEWKAKAGDVSVSGVYIKKLMDEKAPFTLVDARPKRTADKGMIPGAVNIPESEFDKHTDKLPSDKAALLIYYCGGLECVLSGKSADKARKLGYTNVATYPEGWPEWEKLYGAAKPAVLEEGKEKGVVTVASFEKLWRENPAAVFLVDVRDAKEFAAGGIKGAVNIAIGELDKKLDLLPKDKPTIFYCGTGARAGEAYDTVKLLRPELPVHFLDADIKFNPDGGFSARQK